MLLHLALGQEAALLVVFALSVAEGAVFARRFRVLALLPFVCVNTAFICLLWAAARSHDVGLLVELALVSAVSVQVGYLADQVGFARLRLR